MANYRLHIICYILTLASKNTYMVENDGVAGMDNLYGGGSIDRWWMKALVEVEATEAENDGR